MTQEASRFALDHVAIAVPRIDAVLDRLTDELGATIIAGEELAGFRYALLRVGDADRGMNLEVLEPWRATEDHFLTRFLDARGSGPHHLTFLERDIAGTVRVLGDAGIPAVGTRLDRAAWQETFVPPSHACGTVVQIAGSDVGWPPMADLLDAAHRSVPPPPLPYASDEGDRAWWRPRAARAAPSVLDRVLIGVPDLAEARALFVDVLGGRVTADSSDGLDLQWGRSGRIRFVRSREAGVLELQTAGAGGRTIGGARFT